MLKFGTDGIRGIVGKDLDNETIFKLGCALGKKIKNCKILLSKDNRISSEFVSTLFTAGVISQGGNVTDIGYLSTAGVSYLVTNGYDYGVMISASHNPAEYNGIKVFDRTGRKLFSEEERELEIIMNEEFPHNDIYGKYKIAGYLKERYFNYLRKIADNMSGISILLDLSNGVTSYYANSIFSDSGANTKVVNDSFNGRIINIESGILDYNLLLERKIKSGCDFALAVDGDGDRVVIIDRHNNILTGDHILFLLANFYKNQKKIKTVVGTIQTNLGVEKCLNSMGINLVRSDVGDKNVMKEMLRTGAVLGAEQSGHIIIKDYLKTGDGIISGLVALKTILYFENCNRYEEVISNLKTLPQVNKDYVFNHNNIMENEELQNFLKHNSLLLGKDYRQVIRKSGSENKIRIMVEGINKDKCNLYATEIYEKIKSFD